MDSHPTQSHARNQKPWRKEEVSHVCFIMSLIDRLKYIKQHYKPLSGSSAGQDGYLSRERSDWIESLTRKDHVFINFICNDWNAMSLADLKDISNVVLGVDRPTRIWRIIVNDCHGITIDLGFQVLQINLPVRIRKQVIGLALNTISST